LQKKTNVKKLFIKSSGYFLKGEGIYGYFYKLAAFNNDGIEKKRFKTIEKLNRDRDHLQ